MYELLSFSNSTKIAASVLAISTSPPVGDAILNRGAQETTIEHADGTTSTVRIDDGEELQQHSERNGKAGFD